MKLLLTSQMIHNQSIKNSLTELMDKSFSETIVAFIITSHNAAVGDKSWFVQNLMSIYELGWEKFYMIDVAGSDGLDKLSWMKQLEEADVIIMGGGANYFLSYWLEKAGLLESLPELLESKVYIGSSAGSMLAQPALATSSQAMKEFADGNFNINFSELGPLGRSSEKTLGIIDFMIRPHYGSEDRDYVTDELLEKVAEHFKTPIYAIDDDSAIQVVGDEIKVISEGNWKLFE